MASLVDQRWWRRVHRVAQWFLIGFFAFMAVAHLALTVLYFVGVWDTGVGFVLSWEWPAWSITAIDALAVWLLWSAKTSRGATPRRRLTQTVVAGVLVVARAAWFVPVPLAAFVLVLDAAIVAARPEQPH